MMLGLENANLSMTPAVARKEVRVVVFFFLVALTFGFQLRSVADVCMLG